MISLRFLALALPVAAFAISDPPDACTLVTQSDVTAALGAGWATGPAETRTHTADLSSCYYYKGVGNVVAFSILRAANGNAKKTVADRQVNVAKKHAVVAMPELCEGGFSESLSKSNTTIIAAHGKWQVQLQVLKNNLPDVVASKILVAAACKRM